MHQLRHRVHARRMRQVRVLLAGALDVAQIDAIHEFQDQLTHRAHILVFAV